MAYRNVSDSVADRESRIIYNWLMNLNVLESIYPLEKSEKSRVCYHLIGEIVSFKDFKDKIKPTVINVTKKTKNFSDWIEIPKVRNHFCVENNISKNQFNELLIRYIEKYPDAFQFSTATAFRSEVEREGLNIHNKIYFYIRIGRYR